MIETIIVLLNFAFKWLRLVNETRTIGLVQASKQANQLARAIDRAGNATNFTENCASKTFFVSGIKKGVLRKPPIRENNTCVCFHQGHNWKNELLLARAFFIRSVLS